jgi:hypothetical protein
MGHPTPVVPVVQLAQFLDGIPDLLRRYDDHGAFVGFGGRDGCKGRGADVVRQTGAATHGPGGDPFQSGLFPPAALQRLDAFVIAVFTESTAHGIINRSFRPEVQGSHTGVKLDVEIQIAVVSNKAFGMVIL